MVFVTETLSTFTALIFIAVKIHVFPQVMLSSKMLLTLSTRIHLSCSM